MTFNMRKTSKSNVLRGKSILVILTPDTFLRRAVLDAIRASVDRRQKKCLDWRDA
jgi:hypothetical protein